MDHGTREHAEYNPSGSHRWMNCHGCIRLARTAPPLPPSEYALDGTEAHELLELCLSGRQRDVALASAYAGRKDDEDRIEAVQTAVNYVFSILDTHPDAVMYLEERVHLPSQMAPGRVHGTADIVIYIPSYDIVYVIDYKHGAGVAVDVVTYDAQGKRHVNSQALMYTVGALDDIYRIPASFDTTICCVIIQPRAFHPDGPIREALVTNEELQSFFDDMERAIAECEKPDAPVTPGSWCRWCPASSVCTAREDRARALVAPLVASFREFTPAQLPAVQHLPVDRLVAIADAAEFIRDFVKEAEEALFAHAMGGGFVPGRKLVDAQGKRIWLGGKTNQDNIALELMTLTGCSIDEIMPRKLVGIGDAEEVVKKQYKAVATPGAKARDINEAVRVTMARLTDKTNRGKYSLVPLTDRRAAVNAPSTYSMTHQGGVIPTPED